MHRSLPMFAVLCALAACAPPPDFQPRADAAREACQLDAPSALVAEALAPATLTPACAAHLAADLALDVPQLTEVDGRSPIEGDAATRGGSLLQVALLALAVDLGPAEALGLDLPTSDPTAGGAVYDYVTGLVTASRGGLDASLWARMALRQRHLEVHRPLAGVFGISVLLHEARHGETGEEHVPCPSDPSLGCDADADGPYAWQAALLATAAEASEDPELAEALVARALAYEARVP